MTIAPDWKYANENPLFPATEKQLQVMNLMRQFDGCSLWREARVKEMERKLKHAEISHADIWAFVKKKGLSGEYADGAGDWEEQQL